MKFDELVNAAWLNFGGRFAGMTGRNIKGYKNRFAELQAGIVTR